MDGRHDHRGTGERPCCRGASLSGEAFSGAWALGTPLHRRRCVRARAGFSACCSRFGVQWQARPAPSGLHMLPPVLLGSAWLPLARLVPIRAFTRRQCRPTACQVGDLLDRGDTEIPLMYWLERLRRQVCSLRTSLRSCSPAVAGVELGGCLARSSRGAVGFAPP